MDIASLVAPLRDPIDMQAAKKARLAPTRALGFRQMVLSPSRTQRSPSPDSPGHPSSQYMSMLLALYTHWQVALRYTGCLDVPGNLAMGISESLKEIAPFGGTPMLL